MITQIFFFFRILKFITVLVIIVLFITFLTWNDSKITHTYFFDTIFLTERFNLTYFFGYTRSDFLLLDITSTGRS
jgi:hypothetical protein